MLLFFEKVTDTNDGDTRTVKTYKPAAAALFLAFGYGLTRNPGYAYSRSPSMEGFFHFSLALGSAFTIASIFVIITAFSILKKKSPGIPAMIGGVLMATGFIIAIACSYSPGSIMMLYPVALIMGVGVGFLYLIPYYIVIHWFPERTGLWLALVYACTQAGGMLITLLHGCFPLSLPRSWNPSALLVTGVIALALMITGACLVRTPSEEKPAEPNRMPVENGFSVKALFNDYRFYLLCLLMAIPFWASFTNEILYGGWNPPGPAESVSFHSHNAQMAGNLVGIPLFIIICALSDRVGRRIMFSVTCITAAVFSGLLHMLPDTIIRLYTGNTLLSFQATAIEVLLIALISDMSSKKSFVKLLVCILAGSLVLSTVNRWAYSFLIDNAYIASIIILLLSAGMIWKVRIRKMGLP